MGRKAYYLFLDESGNHGLTELNPDFPVFMLCGVLIEADEYITFRDSLNGIKSNFWGNKEVVFHSRDIRKCQKEFQILLNLDVKTQFYEQLNACITDANFNIIASAIQKDKYIKRFGKLSNDVYELSLSFIIERAIFCLNDLPGEKRLEIIIERRGGKEDKNLDEHFQRLMSRGTGFVDSIRLKSHFCRIHFRSKKENINGLQLADLIAYPCARHVIEPNRANPAFDVFVNKIYSKGEKRYGFKIYP